MACLVQKSKLKKYKQNVLFLMGELQYTIGDKNKECFETDID